MPSLVPVAATIHLLVLFFVPTAQAADPAEKCEASKLKEASKYCSCRLNAESKGIRKALPPDFTKCETKFSSKWATAETKAGPGICPSEGDEGAMDARITAATGDIAALLGGDTPVSRCPASGQLVAYGPGSDGDVRAGAPLAYVDNGDGTITDLNTGLMWEKKDDSGGVHDQDNTYTWSVGPNPPPMNGTILTAFLDTLNDAAGGGASCFAGYCDWRIPNVKELQGIVDYGSFHPSIDPSFHQAGTCTGCADVALATCSCTAQAGYWTSTNTESSTNLAWRVGFTDGGVDTSFKEVGLYRARAVRGGL